MKSAEQTVFTDEKKSVSTKAAATSATDRNEHHESKAFGSIDLWGVRKNYRSMVWKRSYFA